MGEGLACHEAAALYERDPFTHVYLVYDLIYERFRTSVYVERSGGEVVGYVLVWRGPRRVGVHVWGEAERVLGRARLREECRGGCIVQVHSGYLLDRVLEELEGLEGLRVKWYLDMAVSEESFKPYRGARTVKLDPGNPAHVEALVELKSVQGVSVSPGEARILIKTIRYHGVFVDGKLASIAGTYVRTRDVWVVGDVYTRPELRGRGYAKAATSAVTSEALGAGASAFLHVEEGNKPARRVYEALGYRVIGRKPWVYAGKP